MKIGYARVSTIGQNLNMQTDALIAAGCEKIYSEKVTGRDMSRPELQACLKSLRAGDELIVWRLDRLGRSLKDLINIVSDLASSDVIFKSLTENIDTNTATGKLFLGVFGALAEFEKNLISERTKSGLAASRKRGVNGGRPGKLDENAQAMVAMLLADPTTVVTDVAKQFGVCRSTLYRYAKQNTITTTGEKPESTKKRVHPGPQVNTKTKVKVKVKKPAVKQKAKGITK